MCHFLLSHVQAAGYVDGDVTFDPPLSTYYQSGVPLQTDVRSVVVVMDARVRKLRVDFFLTTSGAFFASLALADLLKRYQANLRILPAETRYANGERTDKQYCLIHADDKSPVFDYRRSSYAGKALALGRLERGEDPGRFLIKSVQSVVVDPAGSSEHHFFFLKNVVLMDPIISGELAQAIRDHGFHVELRLLGAGAHKDDRQAPLG